MDEKKKISMKDIVENALKNGVSKDDVDNADFEKNKSNEKKEDIIK